MKISNKKRICHSTDSVIWEMSLSVGEFNQKYSISHIYKSDEEPWSRNAIAHGLILARLKLRARVEKNGN